MKRALVMLSCAVLAALSLVVIGCGGDDASDAAGDDGGSASDGASEVGSGADAADQRPADTCPSGCLPKPCPVVAPCVLAYGPSADQWVVEQMYSFPSWTWTMATEAMWRSMTTADFAKYNVILFGDNSMGEPHPDQLQAALDTRATWSAAITARAIVQGLDPGWHASDTGASGSALVRSEAGTLLKAELTWLLDPAGTSLYVTSDHGSRHLDFLSSIGTFHSIPMPGDVARITDTSHPVMAGSTDSSLSMWNVSYHSGIDSFPASFHAIATGQVGMDSSAPMPIVVISP